MPFPQVPHADQLSSQPWTLMSYAHEAFDREHRCRLAMNLNRMRKQLPAEYDFVPDTWCLLPALCSLNPDPKP